MLNKYSLLKRVIELVKDGEDIPYIITKYISPGVICKIIDRYNDQGYQNYYETCTHCEILTTTTMDTEDGCVCDSCYNSWGYIQCDHCVDVCTRDGITVYNGSNAPHEWCQYCADSDAKRCECCEEYFQRDDLFITEDGSTICTDCVEAYYFRCTSCDCLLHNDDYSCDGFCINCIDYEDGDENEDQKSIILNYSSKAEVLLRWGTPEYKDLFLGMELEVESTTGEYGTKDELNRIATNLLQATNRIILCEDGSLHNGFEIKTPPTNLDELRDIATKICNSEARRDLRSHDSGRCGLHIHISRAALSQLQQGKIYQFINAPKNKKLVRSIARRYSIESYHDGQSNYTRIEPDAKKEDITKSWCRDPATKKVLSKSGNVNETRYTSVNFTRKTLEIRILRGTLLLPSLLAGIEWVTALVYFTKTGEINAGHGETTEEFLNWLTKHPEKRTKWGNLLKYLVAKGFLPETELPKPRKTKCA